MNLSDRILIYILTAYPYLLAILSFFILAAVLLNMKPQMKKLRNTLPEDLIPHRYISARRILGTAYIFIGTVILIHLYLHPAGDLSNLYPGEILLIGSAQMILTLAALLSLYNSQMVCRCTVMASIAIFMVPVFVESISTSFSISNNIVRITLFTLFIIQIILYTAVFISERRRYVRTMEGKLGNDEAANYRKKGSTVLFILMLILSVCALIPLFITDLCCAGVFVTAYTIYNIALGVYFHLSIDESSVVQEITTENKN